MFDLQLPYSNRVEHKKSALVLFFCFWAWLEDITGKPRRHTTTVFRTTVFSLRYRSAFSFLSIDREEAEKPQESFYHKKILDSSSALCLRESQEALASSPLPLENAGNVGCVQFSEVKSIQSSRLDIGGRDERILRYTIHTSNGLHYAKYPQFTFILPPSDQEKWDRTLLLLLLRW